MACGTRKRQCSVTRQLTGSKSSLDRFGNRAHPERRSSKMKKTTEVWPLDTQTRDALTITSLPVWARSGDVVYRRGQRWVLVSLHESEPRWRRWLQWLEKLSRSLCAACSVR